MLRSNVENGGALEVQEEVNEAGARIWIGN